jgi:hypothetical protein
MNLSASPTDTKGQTMKTNNQLREIAEKILIDARKDWAHEALDEVLENLLWCWAREEQLTSAEIDTIRDMMSASA